MIINILINLCFRGAMDMTIGLWQLLGFGFTSLFGTILHFLYDFTNKSVYAAPFSGVNESTWEHMKLLFFPALVFMIIEWRFTGRSRPDYWCVKLRGTLLGLSSIPVLFYTLNGTFGKTPDWVNITIFFVSAAYMYLWEYRKFGSETVSCHRPKAALLILIIIALTFVIFTFITPKLPIFMDPATMTYGIQK